MELIENNLKSGLRIAGVIEYIESLSDNQRQKILKSVNDRTKGRSFEISALTALRGVSGPQIHFEVSYKDGSGRQGWTILLDNTQ